VWWSIETATMLVDAGVWIGACWDIAVVHRLLAGGWRADPALVWATLRELPLESIPVSRPLDLFTQAEPEMGDPEHPVRPDGYLRPDWVDGGWAERPERLARWAGLAAQAANLQEGRLSTVERSHAVATARAESAAELLCAELAAGGLPMDRDEAERIIAGFVGPRPRTDADAAAARRRRDDEVLRHAPRGAPVDLRHPAQVKSMFWRAGLDVFRAFGGTASARPRNPEPLFRREAAANVPGQQVKPELALGGYRRTAKLGAVDFDLTVYPV
jgi:DNA polymerase-1